MRSWHTLTKLPNCFSDQNMKRYVTTILSLGLLAGSAHASSGIYLCTDKKGNKEYRNTNITKDCKKVDLPYLTTIPAPVAPKPEPQRSEESKKFPQVDKVKAGSPRQGAQENPGRRATCRKEKTEYAKKRIQQRRA